METVANPDVLRRQRVYRPKASTVKRCANFTDTYGRYYMRVTEGDDTQFWVHFRPGDAPFPQQYVTMANTTGDTYSVIMSVPVGLTKGAKSTVCMVILGYPLVR
jgi:hypothetical protein